MELLNLILFCSLITVSFYFIVKCLGRISFLENEVSNISKRNEALEEHLGLSAVVVLDANNIKQVKIVKHEPSQKQRQILFD